jgi:tetratricopeptide (TPR) repeat protein
MWKNPVVTAIAGLLLGFFVGYMVAQGQPTGVVAAGGPSAGTQSLDRVPAQPPEGGRTTASANPKLMEEVRELDRQLASDPNNYTLLVQSGNVQYDLGNFFKARDFYEKARQIKDDSADVLTDLGVCYRETKEPQKAVELFDRAAEMAPDHWQSLYNAAVVRIFDMNDLDGAQAEVDKLKALGLSDPHLPSIEALEKEIAKRRK